METRQAALCVIRKGRAFLVAEIYDAHGGTRLHRPPGGGIEQDESPAQAVRRELFEQLGIVLTCVEHIGTIDHTWRWKSREIRERAWIFLARAADCRGLSSDEMPEVEEADGECYETVWRSLDTNVEGLPPLCPSGLSDLLQPLPGE
jgi:ADP-ribose pyrophosphatase YjhB (NUDIX family)